MTGRDRGEGVSIVYIVASEEQKLEPGCRTHDDMLGWFKKIFMGFVLHIGDPFDRMGNGK